MAIDPTRNLRHVTTLCGQCSCGCPEVSIDDSAPEDRRVVITDDFGQQVEMSLDQLGDLVVQAKAGVLDGLVGVGAG
ncbi:MAG TPA: hypothetical protein VFW63_11655 [Acidimicrobiales bacterium]|nr:hypothetical protein [Acidimicrobiales bacterium]